MDDIKNLWYEFDEDGDGFITFSNFWRFSSRISIIYGVK